MLSRRKKEKPKASAGMVGGLIFWEGKGGSRASWLSWRVEEYEPSLA
jgi:hypothetical protein